MSTRTFKFNPERVAHFEVEGWKAHYDHAWFKLLGLVVALAQEQFHIPFPVSLLAAYYITAPRSHGFPKNMTRPPSAPIWRSFTASPCIIPASSLTLYRSLPSKPVIGTSIVGSLVYPIRRPSSKP